jgi:hypothetical protein
MARFSKLTLRDLFWLILLAAMAVGWYLERNRARAELAKLATRTPAWAFGPANLPAPSKRQKYLADLRERSNVELTQLFDQLPPATAYYTTDEYQCCLTEMARREMVAELQARYEQTLKSDSQQGGGPANAHVLTALRRAQGKPDPLEVQFEVVDGIGNVDGDAASQGAPITFPGIQITLVNVDEGPISVTRGGDYRSGRQTRYRVHLTDERGERIRDSNWPQFGMGGGISSFGPLPSGEKIEGHTPLDARSYVKSPPPGRYQLQVVYAEQEIAGDPDLAGLIVWQSQPVKVQVTNRTPAAYQARLYPWPILGMFVLLAIAFRVVDVWRRSRPGSPPSSLSRWWNWRDAVALALLAGLATGWIVELRLLENAISDVRPDREADWSMEIVR